MIYINSKNFMVDATSDDGTDIFCAARVLNGKVIVFENVPDDYPSKTITIYDNMADFLENTVWLDYIVKGIRSDILRELVAKKKEEEDE